MPDVIQSIRLVRDPSSVEESLSLLTAAIGAAQAAENITDSQLDRLNKRLTRLQMVVSLKFQERK